MKLTQLLTIGAIVGSILLLNQAKAATLVSTIDGGYNLDYYDTPSLRISNSTNYTFSNVSLLLQGYQGLNSGQSQTESLGTIAANTLDTVIWGQTGYNGGYGLGTVGPSGDLFSYDYDDTYPQDALNPTPAACIQGGQYCAYVGNFKVTFTATWNNPKFGPSGTPIFSVFTPSSNASGGFVGWEGLDPSGLSETTYDDHAGTPNGVLANIYVGVPSTVPLPSTLPLFAAALLGFGAVGYWIKQKGSARV